MHAGFFLPNRYACLVAGVPCGPAKEGPFFAFSINEGLTFDVIDTENRKTNNSDSNNTTRVNPMFRDIFRAATLALLVLPLAAMAAPRISYTDIVSGPNSGGENNRGAYLTIIVVILSIADHTYISMGSGGLISPVL